MGNLDVDKAMQTLVEHGFIDKDGHPINIRSDAISRHTTTETARKELEALPSVTPKQEPFINKPCVAHQVCHEDKVKVLDKIRADMELERVGYPPSSDYRKAIMKCLQIIDKYKTEFEQKESEG